MGVPEKAYALRAVKPQLEQFEKAVNDIENQRGVGTLSLAHVAGFYAFKMQATVGDAPDYDMEEVEKSSSSMMLYEAWLGKKGLSQFSAAQAYLECAQRVKEPPKYEQ